MNRTLLILFLVITSTAFSQEKGKAIKSFELTNRRSFLPTKTGEELEIYKFKSGRLTHKYYRTKTLWRFRWNSYKLFTKSNKDQVLESVEYFVNNYDKGYFQIELTQQDKDSLILMSNKKDSMGYPLYSIEYSDLSKYISSIDTFRIDFKEFNDYFMRSKDLGLRELGFLFRIKLIVEFDSNSTSEYHYTGNLYKDVELTRINEFIIYYNIYQNLNTNLFIYTPMDNYFTKENLYRFFLRYLAYKENKREMRLFYEY